jgi:O-antigen ligase
MAVALVVTGVVIVSGAMGKRRVHVFIGVLLLPILWFLWQEVRAPAERFFAPRKEITSLSGRLPVWRTAPKIFSEYPILGSGLGTFEVAFDLNRPPEIKRRWDHAHNDWLQSMIEGGSLSAGCLILLFWYVIGGRSYPPRALTDTLIFGTCILAAILGIGLFSLVDFCLRIPAVATILAMIIGLDASAAWSRVSAVHYSETWLS